MTIPYCIQIGEKVKNASDIEVMILDVFEEINRIYNNWNPDSEVSRLNHLIAHQTCILSLDLTSFLHYVNEIVILTEGLFDPTIDPIKKVWKECLQESKLPSEEQLNVVKSGVGWNKLHFVNQLFWKDSSLTSCDFGGIAKGYAVDLIIEKLKKAGYQNLYVEWGGEIRTIGNHISGRAWKIGIQGMSTIELSNKAIATSGSYFQKWTVDNITYTHIINPHTKEPLQNSVITSVSVIASTCREADAIATALMLFPSKESALMWAAKKGYQVFIF